MKSLFRFNTKDICEISIMCALAIVLDKFVSIKIGATGGSLNISLLPLIIICLRHGIFKGFIATGIIYGLITNSLDGYGINTYPLEYLIGFGSISIVGLFGRHINETLHDITYKNESKLGGYIDIFICVFISMLSWAIIRFFAGSLSSVINYNYTFEAAMIYNLPYVFISAFADLILVMVCLPLIVYLNKIYKTSYLK